MDEANSETALENANRLYSSASRLCRRLRVVRAVGGLSMAKLGVLSLLRREGVTTATALATYLGVQPQSLTRLLADSENEGLIKCRQDQADKRRSLIEITSAGSRLLADEASERGSRLAAAMIGVLTPTEQELVRLAAGLIDRLADAIEPPGTNLVKTGAE
jgi:DNA-binding MarR family transcriptional regulator